MFIEIERLVDEVDGDKLKAIAWQKAAICTSS
jgi:hypothetical protein